MKYGIMLFAFSVFIVTLIFREDCLTGVNWESKEIRTFYGNPRYLNDKAMYFKLPDENLLDEDKVFNPRNYGNNNISNK